MIEEYEGIFLCCNECKQSDDCDPERCDRVVAEIMADQMDEYYEAVIGEK